MANENASGPIDEMGLDSGCDQSEDLFLESLPIAIVILVPDHQIDGQTLEPPIGMRLDELAHKFKVGDVRYLQQDNRQVAGDCVAP